MRLFATIYEIDVLAARKSQKVGYYSDDSLYYVLCLQYTTSNPMVSNLISGR